MLKFLTDVSLSALLKAIQEAFSTFAGQTRDSCVPVVMTKSILSFWYPESLFHIHSKSYYITSL